MWLLLHAFLGLTSVKSKNTTRPLTCNGTETLFSACDASGCGRRGRVEVFRYRVNEDGVCQRQVLAHRPCSARPCVNITTADGR